MRTMYTQYSCILVQHLTKHKEKPVRYWGHCARIKTHEQINQLRNRDAGNIAADSLI